ncbi:MAG: fumarylacetoacetate hydrolase family protein [Xanthobacteraceae bacterium]|nr:fumarylacetoacetate hydrolase family protein [Xanthobacteraceae bacterium]
MTTTEVANRILKAYETGVPIAPVRSEISGLEAAYAVQRATYDAWIKAGRKPAGHKIGLTSKAVQEQLGVHEPDYGTLFSDMILENDAHIGSRAVLQPRVEPEVAFVLKADLAGENLTAEEVIAATDYVVPAVEVCGSRVKGWDIRFEDTVADNASSGLVVLGSQKWKPVLPKLADVAVRVRLNGADCAEGRGAACLGNPANAVAWLAGALTRLGDRLRAGDVVMSGAMAKMVPAEAGSRFAADFGAFGMVTLQFDR